MRHIVIAVAAAALLAGCGSSTLEAGESNVVVDDDPVATPYSGPMTKERDFSDNATVAERSGAAGLALECDFEPYSGGGGAYDSGLESVQGSPAEAVENWLDNESWGQLPETGYQVEREDGDRVLLSYDVDERTKIAFIAADGIKDYEDNVGWGVESWAQCDPAELPASVTEPAGIGVWKDGSGARVPVTRVESYQGAEHCSWQNITFLKVGAKHEGDQFVRDTEGELADNLKTTYDASATLPENATDSGFHRDGRQLWLVPGHEAAYLVSLDDATDVERWPAAKGQGIYCA